MVVALSMWKAETPAFHIILSDQALTPAPIGHDTPVPPSPQ
jgi:hypothetical protein